MTDSALRVSSLIAPETDFLNYPAVGTQPWPRRARLDNRCFTMAHYPDLVPLIDCDALCIHA